MTYAAKFRNPKTNEIKYVWEQTDIDYYRDVLNYEFIGYVDFDEKTNKEIESENKKMKRTESRNFKEGYNNPFTNAKQKKAFDDACDCIHDGYGKMYWKKNFRNGLDISQLDDVWNKAYKYMNESLKENKVMKKSLREGWGNDPTIKVTTEVDMDCDGIRDMVWSGAKDTLADLDDDQLNTIIQILADEYPDGIDETELNDFLWFERDTIADWLGFDDFDALMRGDSFNTESLYIEEINGNYYITDERTEHSLVRDGDYVIFDTEEEAQEYLDEHRDEFTEDDFGFVR